jgi:hypothetical protein
LNFFCHNLSPGKEAKTTPYGSDIAEAEKANQTHNIGYRHLHKEKKKEDNNANNGSRRRTHPLTPLTSDFMVSTRITSQSRVQPKAIGVHKGVKKRLHRYRHVTFLPHIAAQ